MRIGFDAKRAFHNRSGLGNYSRTLLDNLSTLYKEDEYYLYTPSVTSLYTKANENQKFVSPYSFFNNQLPFLWRSYNINKDLVRDGIEIYHGLSNELPYKLAKSGIKSVVTIHDLIFLRYPEWYPFLDRFFYKRKFLQACQQADAIIAMSEQTKNDIIEFLKIDPEKIHVIYQTCSPLFQKLLNDEELDKVKVKYNLPHEYILYVGTIEPRKNLLNLVKALHKLPAHLKMPLIILGRPTAYKREVEEYASKAGLSSKVHFLSNVEAEEMPSLYQQATVFVYPSIFEGFGIPIIEALYSEVPVITSSGSCFKEAGGPDSMYASPFDVRELSDAMTKVLSSTELRRKMSEKGRLYVQKFDAKIVTKQVHKLYASL